MVHDTWLTNPHGTKRHAPNPPYRAVSELVYARAGADRVLLGGSAHTNTDADWTKTKSRPRHWFTRTRLTNGRRAKLRATLPSRSAGKRRTPSGARGRCPHHGEGLPHKREHRLVTSLVHTYRSNQWASFNAAHSPTPGDEHAHGHRPILRMHRPRGYVGSGVPRCGYGR